MRELIVNSHDVYGSLNIARIIKDYAFFVKENIRLKK